MTHDPAQERDPLEPTDRGAPATFDTASDATRERWAFLAEASRCLADSLDYEETVETVAGLALPLLGSWSIVDITERRGSVRRLAIVHPDPEKQSVARALKAGWPPRREDPVGVSVVAQTGETAVVSDISEDFLERVARGPENLGHLRELGMTSLITVPMRARGRVVGAITFISSSRSRRFNDADVSLAEDLAERCALAIDNARLHRAAQTLAESERARLEARAASQVKSEFLATVSHELRTPINVMAGYLELLAMELAGPLTDQQRAYIGRTRAAEEQLLRIVEDMLNFVRLYEKEVEYDLTDVMVRRMVTDAVEAYRDGFDQKELELVVRCEADVRAYADPAKVWQILMNLLSNARKFTDPGGKVTVECTSEEEHAVIQVTDTGCGIPSEKLEAVFEPFLQVEASLTRTAEGMGLGLSISRHLARDMGGDLKVISPGTGKGGTFVLTLPVTGT